MLEAQPLHGVVELDVDAEIVGVQLQLVAGLQPAVLPDVHAERGDAAVELEPPVLVARRLRPEVDLHVLACFFHFRSYPRITHRTRALRVPTFSQPCGRPPSSSALSPVSSVCRSPL